MISNEAFTAKTELLADRIIAAMSRFDLMVTDAFVVVSGIMSQGNDLTLRHITGTQMDMLMARISEKAGYDVERAESVAAPAADESDLIVELVEDEEDEEEYI